MRIMWVQSILNLAGCLLKGTKGPEGSMLCTVWYRVLYRPYLMSFHIHSPLDSNIPILQIKKLKLRKMIKYVSQEYTVDNHTWFQILCSFILCYSFCLRTCEMHFTYRILVKSLHSKKKRERERKTFLTKSETLGIKEYATSDPCFKMTRVCDENYQKHIL